MNRLAPFFSLQTKLKFFGVISFTAGLCLGVLLFKLIGMTSYNETPATIENISHTSNIGMPDIELISLSDDLSTEEYELLVMYGYASEETIEKGMESSKHEKLEEMNIEAGKTIAVQHMNFIIPIITLTQVQKAFTFGADSLLDILSTLKPQYDIPKQIQFHNIIGTNTINRLIMELASGRDISANKISISTGTFVQDGGSLKLNHFVVSAPINDPESRPYYEVESGKLQTEMMLIKQGQFTQSGGSVTADTITIEETDPQNPDEPAFELKGTGTLEAKKIIITDATLLQSGGTAEVTETLTLVTADSSLWLSGGTLHVDQIIAEPGAGEVRFDGGELKTTKPISVAKVYVGYANNEQAVLVNDINLSFDELDQLNIGKEKNVTGRFDVGRQDVAVDSIILGDEGFGTIKQYGSTITADEITLADKPDSTGNLWLAGGTFHVTQFLAGEGTSTLIFDGGTLDTTGTINVSELHIGYENTASWDFDANNYSIESVNLLSIGSQQNGTGIVDIEQNNVEVTTILVGDAGFGTLNQYGSDIITTMLALGSAAGSQGIYNLSGGTLVSPDIFVGASGTGTFNHTGGTIQTPGSTPLTIWIGNDNGGTGTYSISNNANLSVAQLWIGNNGGTGIFNQSDATVNAPEITLGATTGSEGTYNLSDGTLVSPDIFVGASGTGIFNHTGGTIQAPNSTALTIWIGNDNGGSGTYSISNNANLSVAQLWIGNNGGTGIFNQSDATVNAPEITLGATTGSEGAYNLSGGTLSCAHLTIGLEGTGFFNHSGGTIDGQYNTMWLGKAAGGTGTYTLSNNATLTYWLSYIGSNGGTGYFDHINGDVDVSFFYIGLGTGSEGWYNLYQGSLSADEINVGVNGTGYFIQHSGILDQGGMALGINFGGEGTLVTLNDSSLNLQNLQVGKVDGIGHVEHIGGTIELNQLIIGLRGGNGDYTLGMDAANSSIAAIASLQLDPQNPVLEVDQVQVGYNGTGTFSLMQGGTLKAQDLIIGIQESVDYDTHGIFDFHGGNIIGTKDKNGSMVFETFMSNGELVLSDGLFDTNFLYLGFSPNETQPAQSAVLEFRGGALKVTEPIIMSGGIDSEIKFIFNDPSPIRTSEVFQADIAYNGGSFHKKVEIEQGQVVLDDNFLTKLQVGEFSYKLFLNGGTFKVEQAGSIPQLFWLFFNGGELDLSDAADNRLPDTTVVGYTQGNNVAIDDTYYDWSNIWTLFVGYEEGTGTVTQKTRDINLSNIRLGNAGATAHGSYVLEDKELTVTNMIAIGEVGQGVFTQNGGQVTTPSLYLANQTTGSGEYILNTGLLISTSEINIGEAGQGVFTQNGGQVTARSIYLGNQATGSGEYVVNSDSLISTSELSIGRGGTGTFTQNDGQINATSMTLGYSGSSSGEYIMSSGSLNISIGFIGNTGTGTFTQNGGQVGADALYFGYFADGSGEYILNSGSLTTMFEIHIGRSGTGTFTQNNGQVEAVDVYLGYFADGSGEYSMNAGTLDISDRLIVGQDGTGRFTQSGGQVNSNYLFLSPATTASGEYIATNDAVCEVQTTSYIGHRGAGTLTLSDNSRHSTSLLILGAMGGSGTVNVNDSATLETDILELGTDEGSNNHFNINSAQAHISSNYITFGPNLTFTAVENSSITMNDSNHNGINIASTDPQALAGLNNLTINIETPALEMEVAGEDFGENLDGFILNFALNELIFSVDSVLTLVGGFDNQPDFAGVEALYVKDITALAGVNATIENSDGSGSIRIYYQNLTGNVTATDPANFIQIPASGETGFSPPFNSFGPDVTPYNASVPEPSACLLMMFGGILLVRTVSNRKKSS